MARRRPRVPDPGRRYIVLEFCKAYRDQRGIELSRGRLDQVEFFDGLLRKLRLELRAMRRAR